MHHTLKIGIGKNAPPDGGIVRCQKRQVRERVLRWLLGKRLTVTILVPGDSVKTLSITEEADDSG
ncbi:MAG: hypothetical protein LBG83_03605 [Oscillospiraceae bacterium]|jgi:hypothetical protein|nr:hypothetical protein [Oscillospiraceae bacterium]